MNKTVNNTKRIRRVFVPKHKRKSGAFRPSAKLQTYSKLGILLFLLVLGACKDPVEGCLDIEAANYNVAADDPCPDDCCTYPNIILSVSHNYQDSFRFSFDSVYTDAGGNMGQFQQVIFYLSDFRLLTLDGSDSLETTETIELDLLSGGSEVFKDDYTLVSRSIPSFSYDVAEIRDKGSFTNLKFSVGIAGNAAVTNASTAPEDHPLALNEGVDTLWTLADGYVFNRVIVIPDTTSSDSVRQFDLKNLQEITLSFQQEVNLGFDVTIPLKIDYKEWFSGIDFVDATDSEIVEIIVENTANAFSITE